MRVEIRYLHQSGFEVRLLERYLLFDYDGRGAAPEKRGLLSKGAVVFASHRHGDHFSREILAYPDQNPTLTLVLSDDIAIERHRGETIRSVAPRQQLKLPGVQIRTLRSTDEGVAFLVRTEGMTIYHAGDLNWWHWEGESDSWNKAMARNYRAEIDTLVGEQIDLAFLPVDGRLGAAARWGADYFMEKVGAKYVVPMHFWDDRSVFSTLRDAHYAAQVRIPPENNDWFSVEI